MWLFKVFLRSLIGLIPINSHKKILKILKKRDRTNINISNINLTIFFLLLGTPGVFDVLTQVQTQADMTSCSGIDISGTMFGFLTTLHGISDTPTWYFMFFGNRLGYLHTFLLQ